MKLIIKYGGKEIEAIPSLTILDNLEANHINVGYQCREGYCGACCMKLLSGNVEYIEEPMAFCDEGEILPCICKALTNIHISKI